MLALDPGERARKIVRILVGVAWTSNRIADGGISAHLNKWRADSGFESWRVRKSQAGGIGVVQMFVEQKFISQIGEAENPEYCGREGVRFLRHEILVALVFSHGKSGDICTRSRKRVGLVALAETVADVEHVALGKKVIQAHTELIGIAGERLRAYESKCTGIGVGIKRQQILRNWIDEGQDVVGNRLTRKFVKELAILAELASVIVDAQALRIERAVVQRALIGEISGAFGVGRDGGAGGFALAIAQALVVHKEKCFVFADGTAKGSAELIALQGFDAIGEETLCVHGVVAKKFPGGAVKIVRSGAGNDVGGGTGAMTKFGVGGVGEDAELRDCIDGRFQHKATVNGIEVVRAIDQKIVGFGALAVDCVGLALAQRTSRLFEAGSDRDNARLQKAELRKVAPIQGKIENLALCNCLAEVR